jgi:hypothetical protein
MASIFSGLGRGLGKAAIGYEAGNIAAEKENYRRNQIAEERAYRKELVGLKKKEEDPYKDLRGAAKGIATTLSGRLTDWTNQGIINSPAMVPRVRALRNALQHSLDFLAGKIKPEDFDTNILRQDPTADASDPVEAGGLSGPVAAPGGPTASPAPTPTASPFVSNNQVNAMLDATPRAVASMGSAYPAGVAGQVATRMALGALGVPFPQPPAPAAAGKPVPQPKPKTPVQELKEFINAGPPAVERGYMTDPQWRAAKAEARQSWESQVRARTAGLSLEDRQRLLGAQADKAVSGARVAPELDRQRVVGGVARIEGTRAQTGLNKALTPIKVRVGKAQAKVAELKPKVIEREQARKDRAQGEVERRNRELEAQNRQREARIVSQAERALTTKVGDKTLDAIKTQLSKQLSRYQAKRQLASGSTVPAEEPGVRDKIGKEIERLMQRLREVEKTGGPVSVTTTKRTGGTQRTSSSSRNAPVLGRGAVKPRLPKGVDDSDYKAVSGLISGGKFDGFARGLKGPARAQAKAIYKHKTGRDWGG